MRSKRVNVCKSPGIELAWDRHSTPGHSFLPFHQQNWNYRHPWADKKGGFGGERTSRCQLPPPLSPPQSHFVRNLRPLQEDTFASSRGCQSLWDIWARSLPLLILPWSCTFQTEGSQILLFRIWPYLGVKPSVFFFLPQFFQLCFLIPSWLPPPLLCLN